MTRNQPLKKSNWLWNCCGVTTTGVRCVAREFGERDRPRMPTSLFPAAVRASSTAQFALGVITPLSHTTL
jgi:hypothetical protein